MEITIHPTNGMTPYTGYGKVEIGLLHGLKSAGVRVYIPPARHRVTLTVGYPKWLALPHIAETRRWLFTMSETDRVSEKWVRLINENAERVLLPCEALIEVYRTSGVTVPLHSVGIGVDAAVPNAAPPRSDARFTFLAYTYGDTRKGGHEAVAAFLAEFSDDPNVRLILKARDHGDAPWLSDVESLNVHIVRGAQSDNEWYGLVARADCFVFPSRGEGYGMPPREAALLGIPAIATEWLGMADVSEWGIPLGVKSLSPSRFDAYEANAEGSRWAQPDFGQLRRLMRWVYENRAEAAAIAGRGGEYLQQTATWPLVGERIAALLRETEGITC